MIERAWETPEERKARLAWERADKLRDTGEQGILYADYAATKYRWALEDADADRSRFATASGKEWIVVEARRHAVVAKRAGRLGCRVATFRPYPRHNGWGEHHTCIGGVCADETPDLIADWDANYDPRDLA